ncbi:hypothetical protein EEB15_32215 [Ramlibacter sp. WS9]|nr:hypothetical protein EEB15_32215 [Ramlibacter sp. WS9]
MLNNLVVAKPYTDMLGADLIAFSEFDDGLRFCRIQCKGRSLKEKGRTTIQIPKSYVDSPFMVVLFLMFDRGSSQLLCFFSSDIRQWQSSAKGTYVLSLSRKKVEEHLQFYRFSESKMDILKTLIQKANESGTFYEAVYGSANAVLKIGGGESPGSA